MVGTAVKAKIGELEEEVRVGSTRRMRKELTGVPTTILFPLPFEFCSVGREPCEETIDF